jgi:serine/threonine protein kinase
MSSTPQPNRDPSAAPDPDDDAPEHDALLGTLVSDRYRIQRVMGKGGMGVVYSARQEAMERDVAVKVLLPMIASDRRATKRFLAEARIAGGLGHPNVVDVYDLGTLPDGRPFLVMPKLHGKSLDQVLDAHVRLPPTHVAAIVRAIANALDAMHARDIVHRDLKPENLFLAQQPDGTDVVKLLDFGLATLLGEGTERLTRTGMIVGTPEYLPPEAGDGRMVDVRGDVYSLACIGYEALTGRLPIEGASPTAQLLRKMSSDAPPLSVHGKSYSKALEATVARGLARDPDERFQRAGDFAEAFVAAVEESFGRAPRSLRLTHPDLQIAASQDRAAIAAAVGTEDPIPLVESSMRPRSIPGTKFDIEPPDMTEPTGTPSNQSLPIPERRSPLVRNSLIAVAVLLLLAIGVMGGLLMQDPEDTVAVPTPATQGQGEPTSGTPTPPAAAVPAPVSMNHAPAAHEVQETPEPAAAPTARDNPRTQRVGAGSSETTQAVAPAPTPLTPAAASNDQPAIRGSGETSDRTLDRERASALASEGTSLLIAGRLPAAIEKFREATQANPGNATAWRGLGLAYERMGRAPEARSAYQRYLRIAPNARDAEMIRGRLTDL